MAGDEASDTSDLSHGLSMELVRLKKNAHQNESFRHSVGDLGLVACCGTLACLKIVTERSSGYKCSRDHAVSISNNKDEWRT